MANLKNLKTVRQAIIDHKENFSYGVGIYRKTSFGGIPQFKDLIHNCGTVGCVAGFAVACSKHDTPTNSWPSICDSAQYYLNINGNEIRFLFHAYRRKDLTEPGYLSEYDYPADFDIGSCTDEEGYTEAIKRLDFIIAHYESQE